MIPKNPLNTKLLAKTLAPASLPLVSIAAAIAPRTFLLQDWITVRGGLSYTGALVQDPDRWLDLSGFSDVTCWVEILEVTAPRGGAVQLQLQTAPSADDAYFVPLAPALRVGTSTPFIQPSATPVIVRSAKSSVSNSLMRWLRWSVTPTARAAWDITFRIHAIAARSTTFVPTLIPGCVVWYRADLGVTLSGSSSVTGWSDQSGTGDSNKNLTAGVAPALNVSDANYFGQATITFTSASGTYFTSGSWLSPLVQPDTWLVVGHSATAGSYEVVMESNDTTTGQNVSRLATNEIKMATTSTMSTSTSGGEPWTSPSVVLAEFNGGSSRVYVNDFTTSIATTGTITNSGTTTGQGSLTIGSSDKAWALGNYWGGSIAEIIGYSGLLSATSKAQLRNYLIGRYGIGIG